MASARERQDTTGGGSPVVAARSRALLRVIGALLLAGILLQGVTAGQMLTGADWADTLHSLVGERVLSLVALVQLGVAAWWWRRGGAPRRLPALALLLFLVLGMQVGWGMSGRLALHVPNALVVLAVQLGLVLRLPAARP